MSGEFWFTSDTHFGHKLVAGLRGYIGNGSVERSIESHDADLVEAWNERVKPGDVVFHLGDFMLPYDEDRAKELLKKLHGSKHLVVGNHDPGKLTRLKGWDWTGHLRGRKVDGDAFVLCHYALRSWPGMGKGSMHLYGHSHSNLAPGYGRSMDVGVDTRPDYAPWHIDEVRELLKDVPPLIVDHHDGGVKDLDTEGGEEA